METSTRMNSYYSLELAKGRRNRSKDGIISQDFNINSTADTCSPAALPRVSKLTLTGKSSSRNIRGTRPSNHMTSVEILGKAREQLNIQDPYMVVSMPDHKQPRQRYNANRSIDLTQNSLSRSPSKQ